MTVMSEIPVYAPIIKLETAHERPIVRMFFLATRHDYNLVTVAHDGLKVWNVIDNDDGCSFQKVVEVSKWRCGVQYADMKSSVPEIVVIGLDSILYRISEKVPGSIESLRVDPFDLGYMEVWSCALDETARTCLTTSYSGNITEVDIAGISRAEVTRKEPFPNVKQVCCMAYSNNSRLFAVASNDGTVTLLDHDTLKVKAPMEIHAMKIRAMLFTSMDDHLLTGSDDKSIRLSQIGVDRASTLVRQFCGHRSAITSLSIDPTSGDARFASCSMYGEICIWDINTPTPVHTLKHPHEGILNSVLFSYNGHHLFSAGEDKRLVCYRVPQGGEPIITLEQQEEPIEADESEKENLFGRTPEYGDEEATDAMNSDIYEDSNPEPMNTEEDLDEV